MEWGLGESLSVRWLDITCGLTQARGIVLGETSLDTVRWAQDCCFSLFVVGLPLLVSLTTEL